VEKKQPQNVQRSVRTSLPDPGPRNLVADPAARLVPETGTTRVSRRQPQTSSRCYRGKPLHFFCPLQERGVGPGFNETVQCELRPLLTLRNQLGHDAALAVAVLSPGNPLGFDTTIHPSIPLIALIQTVWGLLIGITRRYIEPATLIDSFGFIHSFRAAFSGQLHS
jgi:hypothetical protein